MDVSLSTNPSPPRVRSLILSLSKWKARSAAKHREIRALRVKVRDLQISRDLWKQRALDPIKSDPNSEHPSPGEDRPSQP
jgi:hypothetical protein